MILEFKKNIFYFQEGVSHLMRDVQIQEHHRRSVDVLTEDIPPPPPPQDYPTDNYRPSHLPSITPDRIIPKSSSSKVTRIKYI